MNKCSDTALYEVNWIRYLIFVSAPMQPYPDSRPHIRSLPAPSAPRCLSAPYATVSGSISDFHIHFRQLFDGFELGYPNQCISIKINLIGYEINKQMLYTYIQVIEMASRVYVS